MVGYVNGHLLRLVSYHNNEMPLICCETLRQKHTHAYARAHTIQMEVVEKQLGSDRK